MSIIKHVTLQKIVAHDFRYNPRNLDVMLVHTAYYTTDTEQKLTDTAMLRNSADRHTVNVT